MNIQKNKKISQAKMDGFTMGVLAGAAVLNDAFDFQDDELRFFMEGSKEVVASISRHQDSAKYIIKELERMTGIELTFS